MAPRLGLLALVGATALLTIQLAVYFPQLPDTVVSHFDAAGNANGTSSKQGFVVLMLCVGAGDLLLFAGFGRLLAVLPVGLINVPNRDYWFAPERREATTAMLAGQLQWFGAATQLLLVGVSQLCIVASLDREPPPGLAMWVLLGGYLVYTIFWLVGLLRRFPKPT